MSDNRFQLWQVSYEGKPAQQITVTAPTALDAARDFALQRPNSGADCVVRVTPTAAGGTAQSFIRERGVWRRKEDMIAATVPVRSKKSARLTPARVGLTVALVLGLLGVMAWTNPSERDHFIGLYGSEQWATFAVGLGGFSNSMKSLDNYGKAFQKGFRTRYKDYFFFSTLFVDDLKQATTLGVFGKVLVVRNWRWRERVSSDSPPADVSSHRSVQNHLITVEGGVLPASPRYPYQQVATFQIGQYEVTWQEWQDVRDWAVANGYSSLNGVGSGSADNHPVSNVRWDEAMAWCNAKSQQEGLSPVYYLEVTETFWTDKRVHREIYRGGKKGLLRKDGKKHLLEGTGSREELIKADTSANGYRLPTEAEWEWAARGGVHSQGYTYSGSEEVDAVAWCRENSGGGTKPVGTKAANELGLYDMSGNVSEFCTHAYVTKLDYELSGKKSGVLDLTWRGGCWGSFDRCKVNSRGYDFWQDSHMASTGLRLARNAP